MQKYMNIYTHNQVHAHAKIISVYYFVLNFAQNLEPLSNARCIKLIIK